MSTRVAEPKARVAAEERIGRIPNLSITRDHPATLSSETLATLGEQKLRHSGSVRSLLSSFACPVGHTWLSVRDDLSEWRQVVVLRDVLVSLEVDYVANARPG